ncbi:O-succinylhomoserine sulfhydrylase [Niveispirillum lacus]|uniref:O-succinylhomoserine sulfhydrylase n=1 Tax=Niveispirillum lacus TaxID=1981099 RepID=A0A255Z3D2_9PROT|nr:O-succinylhomoserine sulfhydrylase [Niveispirillum lacus]OYQ35988.1 O-succinylhomoserine sulfhydrylase [Niveispirillum lacus]
MSDLPDDLNPATQLVHGGTRRSQFEETSEAIFLTSGFVYGSAEAAEAAFVNDGSRFVYSRFRNPTVAMFEDRLAQYEGFPRCFATASGMAAVHAAVFGLLKAGDRLVASRALFGSCLYIVSDLARRFGIESVIIDGTKHEEWEKALSVPTNLVFLETPSNPCLEVVDLEHVVPLAHKAGAKVVVDNVFATPVLQKPRQYGVDVVVYSATKHIDGQGRCLGGAILCDDEVAAQLAPYLRHTGPAMSPFNAWVLLKGLETLELRVKAQSASALAVATFLENHPAVERVLYAGLDSHPQRALLKKQMKAGSNLICFHLKPVNGDAKAAAFATLNGLKIVKISNNLGDSKSLATHPSTTTHQRLTVEEKAILGIGPGTIRLSVGLEDADDIIADLKRGLDTLV